MVVLLFLISSVIAYYGFNYTKLRALSPTFWASVMFALFSFIYAVTMFDMRSDISFKTVLTVTAFLIVTLCGEYAGTKINFTHKRRNLVDSICGAGYIYIARWKIYLLTAVFMIVAVDRYHNVASVASAYAGHGFSNVMQMMSTARLAFVAANRNLVLGNTVFNQLIYLCEFTSLMMIYCFINNLVNYRKKDYYLLLICIPDLIFRFLSTSRTSFIGLMLGVVVFYFIVIQKKRTIRLAHIPKKIIAAVIVFAIAFFAYGRARNDATSIPMVTYLQMYTCSSLYALDYMLTHGWSQNPYFGFHTMQHMYSLLGVSHDVVRTWGEMIVFGKATDAHANLFTSLLWPIQDYRFVGMLTLRFLCAFLSANIITSVFRSDHRNSFYYVRLYFCNVFIYAYVFSAIGDMFPDSFLNPSLIIRYIIYGWIITRFFLKPQTMENCALEGSFTHENSMYCCDL